MMQLNKPKTGIRLVKNLLQTKNPRPELEQYEII